MTQLSEIYQKYLAVKEKIPAEIQSQLLLTGGTAAFLYGSDRKFSNDIDFMVPENSTNILSKALNIEFEVNEKKPIFHSLVAHLTIKDVTYDLIAKSNINPQETKQSFSFYIIPEIVEKKVAFPYQNDQMYCLPKEMLILIKLLAGRGEELGKFDLYDVNKMVEGYVDYDFLKKIAKIFCAPLNISIPILIKNAEKTAKTYNNQKIDLIISSLKQI